MAKFNIKDYFTAAGLSILAALIITFFIWIFSLIGWWVIGGVLAFLLVPAMLKVIQFYRDTNCMDLSDLCVEIDNHFQEKRKKKTSHIDNNIEDIDW
jgi:hypothetical protein